VPASYSEICVTLFQDGNEAMDMKVGEVTDVKEEQDPLAVTCLTDAEQEVSCVSVCPVGSQIAYVPILSTLRLSLLTKWLLAAECTVHSKWLRWSSG
jgi:hypothetical protein